MATADSQSVQPQPGAEPTRGGTVYRPLVDILERPDELLIVADMPGVDPSEIDIDFADRSLTIRGRVRPRQEQGLGYLLHEYGVGDFYRVFQVSEEIDPRQITADYGNGVLTLHLPKAESSRARKIEVHSRG